VAIEMLEAHGPFEDGAAHELLRDRAHAVLFVDLGGADQARRDARGADRDGCRRLVGARKLPDGQCAGEDRQHHRNDEPPFAPAEYRHIVERIETRFVHYCTLTGLEVTIWNPTRLRNNWPPARRLVCFTRA